MCNVPETLIGPKPEKLSDIILDPAAAAASASASSFPLFSLPLLKLGSLSHPPKETTNKHFTKSPTNSVTSLQAL